MYTLYTYASEVFIFLFRAYAASQENVAVDPDAEQDERSLLLKYPSQFSSLVDSDPLLIKE